MTVWLVRIWTHKNADEKAHTLSRRSKNVKKRTKTYEKRILCKLTFMLFISQISLLLCHLIYSKEENVAISLFCLYDISLRYEANLIFCHLRERCIAFPLILFNRSDFLPYTCAVFLGRHDINKTVKNMHLCSSYEKRNLNLHGLINNKYFPDKFLILKFLFS